MLLDAPKVRRWTIDQYYQMAELGWFRDRRVELIEGEVIEMPPQKNEHEVAIGLADLALRKAFGPRWWIRIQLSLLLGDFSEPEPDLAVVPGGPRNYSEKPTTAALVVEIADTTLAYDRGRKASLYARVAIADYWIVNLVDRQLEVRRNPVPNSRKPFGFEYADVAFFKTGETVRPLAASKARIKVRDLFSNFR